MPKFSPLLRRDAWVNYRPAEPIEADTAEEACAIAERAWKEGDPKINFVEDGMSEFDDVLVDPDECDEVAAEGADQ